MGLFGIKSEFFQNVFDLLGVTLPQLGPGFFSEGAFLTAPQLFRTNVGLAMGVVTVTSLPHRPREEGEVALCV